MTVSTARPASRSWHLRRLAILALAGVLLATLIGWLATLHLDIHLDHYPILLMLPDPTRIDIAVAAMVTLAVAGIAVGTAPGRRRLARWGLGVTALVAVAAVAACLMGAGTPPDAAAARLDVRAADVEALAGLMRSYDPALGRWVDGDAVDSGWWLSGATLDIALRADETLGVDPRPMLDRTYRLNRVAFGYLTDFTGHYYDDAGWWGVAWADAYRATGDRRYLQAAQIVDDFMASGWSSSCGGGVAWAIPSIANGSQKGAISNELYTVLSARLYSATAATAYLDRAEQAWTWLHTSGLVQPGRLVWDHLDAQCRPVGTRWSYTTGEAIAAGQALGEATGQAGFTAEARGLADRLVSAPIMSPGGVLTEPCEPAGTCGLNGPMFKGSAVLALGELNAVTPGRPWSAYLTRQAATAYTHDRTPGGLYGLSWSGPVDGTSFSRQASAVALLTATLGGGTA